MVLPLRKANRKLASSNGHSNDLNVCYGV